MSLLGACCTSSWYAAIIAFKSPDRRSWSACCFCFKKSLFDTGISKKSREATITAISTAMIANAAKTKTGFFPIGAGTDSGEVSFSTFLTHYSPQPPQPQHPHPHPQLQLQLQLQLKSGVTAAGTSANACLGFKACFMSCKLNC